MSKNEMLKKNRDELTGLLDKHAFFEWAQELIDSKTEQVDYGFIFFDLDNFKIFNTNYGYEKGDELLKAIADILREAFEHQLVGRFSGDHFVVCTDSMQIVPIITSVKKQVKNLQKNINLELKAGVYIFDGETTDVTRCCDRARMACVSIKKKNDVDYRFYDEALVGNLKRKQLILDTLDEALENDYIKVFYQPIVRAITGRICGWEALVRWNDPTRGMIFPNEFISVLEEYRIIYKLDCYVMEKVIAQFSEMKKEEKMEAVPVSINLSRIDFEVIDVFRYVESLINKYQADKDMFRFEITESVLMDNPKFMEEEIAQFRAKGYKVWMDDFGSGYSSLNVLKNYQFDLVKIDMEFLRGFEDTDNGKIILKHTVSMLKNLGVHTLAEGVETQEQYDFLGNLGCELIQGYLIGRPMPLSEGIEQLKNKKFEYESLESRDFLNTVGKVDVLKQNPLEGIEKNIVESSLPLAIGLVKEGKWKFIYSNDGYKREIRIYGHEDMKLVEDMINNPKLWLKHDQFWKMCLHAKESGEAESIEFIENGRIVNMRARYIALDEHNKIDAYMCSIRYLSNALNENYEQVSKAISNYVFSFYECIDAFGLDKKYYENIYLSVGHMHVKNRNNSAAVILEDIANTRVHKDDREHFLALTNLASIKERLKGEASGAKVGLFRILDANDEFVWKAVTVRIVDLFGREVMLSCVCEACKEMAERMEAYVNADDSAVAIMQSRNQEADAFENVLKLVPAGVFWKDKERRFLGANQMFLDYYGLKSVESIKGKTDEDMGWHINPEPFKQDELIVINEGKTIRNVQGECIVKGEVRKIVASKQPFIVDGEIMGLIGFFNDVTESEKEKENLEALTYTDELTGLQNRRAFEEIIEKYVAQYKQDETDFALVIFDVDKFKKVNDIYGHSFGDLVLQKVAEIIRLVTSNNSVAFRIGGDEFALLHQYSTESEVESIVQEVNLKISQVNQIDGKDFKTSLSVGTAYYSKTKDKKLMFEQADQKMYQNKAKYTKSNP